MAARAFLFRAALAASVLAVSAVEETRSVPHFTGVATSDGIEVHANSTGADGNSSLVLGASPEVMAYVRSYVDSWGTLILSKAPGAGSSQVVAEVTVPGPLTYAGASSGGKLVADAVAGAVVASSQAEIKIETLETSKPTSISASSYSTLDIDGGRVPYISASCSSYSSMRLGELQADSATVSVSSWSSIAGMTVGSATVSASSSSNLTMRATRSVGLSCSASTVRLSGGAVVTQHSNWACILDVSSAKAAALAEKPPAKNAKAQGAAASAVAPAAQAVPLAEKPPAKNAKAQGAAAPAAQAVPLAEKPPAKNAKAQGGVASAAAPAVQAVPVPPPHRRLAGEPVLV